MSTEDCQNAPNQREANSVCEDKKLAEEFIGCAAGKYKWGDKVPNTKADMLPGPAITEYAWCDGKTHASVYVTLDGLDEADDSSLHVSHKETFFSFQVTIGGQKRVLIIEDLQGEIVGIKMVRKKGKNQVCIKLSKKEEKPWHSLVVPGGSSSRRRAD